MSRWRKWKRKSRTWKKVDGLEVEEKEERGRKQRGREVEKEEEEN